MIETVDERTYAEVLASNLAALGITDPPDQDPE
jgi:hypothetical protein